MSRPARPSARFAVKLLFQWRVVASGRSDKRRTCEERIVLLEAKSPRGVLQQARQSGRRAEHVYENAHGNPVHFEFIGVLDLIRLGPECDANEVWYDIRTRVEPMERRDRILRSDEDLIARC